MLLNNKNHKRIITVLLATIMTLLLIFPASAASEAVQETANGVFKIQFHFDFIDGVEPVTSGSCFLINEDTIVTANHCVRLSTNEIKIVNEIFEKNFTEKDIYEHISYTVVVRDDVTINATLEDHAYSENEDFAVLKLDKPINAKTPLKLRDSRTVKAADEVYSVGFPGSKEGSGLYTAKDVAFENGTVNKEQYKDESQVCGFWPLLTCITNNYYYVDKKGNFITDDNGNKIPLNLEEKYGKDNLFKNFGVIRGEGNIYYGLSEFKAETLMLSGNISSSGNSGGPIVDENGCVVAIAHSGTEETSYTTAISQVIEVLDMLGIDYQKAENESDESKDESEIDTSKLSEVLSKAEGIDGKGYTKESYDKLKKAITEARTAVSAKTQSEIDTAAENLQDAIDDLVPVENNTSNSLIYIIIIVIVFLFVCVILLIVMLSKKGKQNTVNSGNTTPNNNNQSFAKPSNETTVLSSGSSTFGMNGGILVRTNTNEQIPISGPDFTVGREYGMVNYCIQNNSGISRVHARFTVRNGRTYITDNNSGNGTYLNGEPLVAGQLIELRNGDVITLANEEFEFYL